MRVSSPGHGRRNDTAPAARIRHGVAWLLQWASRTGSRRLIFGPTAEDLSPTDPTLLEYLTKNGLLRFSDLTTP